ncbi:hypothetical protein IT575_00495 [bacterium]|nr:hypothetical protein [bacterium]
MVPSSGPQQLDAGRGLPPLSQLRGSSALVQYTLLGSEYSASIPGTSLDGNSLVLSSSAGQYSWGIWHFGFAQDATDCVVTMNSSNSGAAWFAVSDFVTNSWAIYGPVSDPQISLDLSVRDFARPGNGDLFIAALSYDGDNINIEQLDLILDVTGGARDVNFSGGYTSMLLVQGRPAIAFYEQNADDLCYIRAGDPFGATWGQSQIVDAFEETGLFNSMQIVDGNPAIAYHNTTSDELRYVRASDPLGDSWGSPEILAGSGSDIMGEFCSLAVIDGRPAVSFNDNGSGTLRYVRANDATGDDWPASILLDNNGNCGVYTSLAVVSGSPAIAYRAGGPADLRFIRAADSTGDTWNPAQELDTENNAGFHNTLLVVNGRPAIAHYDIGFSALMYLRANDETGSSWPAQSLLLDGADDDRGSYGSMAILDGVPAISYHSGIFGDLRFIKANDADGSSWGEGVILDESSVITGRDTSLVVVAGHAAISYFDLTNGQLRYIWGFE